MTPEEAITEAARSGNVVWLRQLLQSYKIHIPEALVPAAANDHLECVEVLLNEFSEAKNWETLKQAAVAAGANGNANVLRCLWKEFNPTKFGGVNTCIAVKQVFDDAADLDVVKLNFINFIAQDAVTANYDMNPSSALSLAIAERGGISVWVGRKLVVLGRCAHHCNSNWPARFRGSSYQSVSRDEEGYTLFSSADTI